ncbi:MAG: type VI secretion system protein [Pseudomonadota bacterium]
MLTDNLFLISIAVLALLVLFVLGLVLYLASKRPATTKTGADPKVAKIRFDSLRSSFRQAVDLIEGNIVSRAERYSIPWIMLLNEGDDHRQLPIAQSGVASALSSEAASAAATQGISWHFFDRGIVIDIKGAYLGSPDEDDGAEKPWDEFLGMCRAYRPQRPFDSVVITVPADLLLNDSADSRLELAKRAKLAHRRLWLAQNRFAMRFAVYVLVTGSERLEGFGEFARALPEPMRASMLGWSSPYDLATTYQDGWVDEAVGSVVRTVSDTSAELFAIDDAMQGPGELLLLPARIEALRSQLQLYVDEIMRPSAYHEPFFLRGIYLTGDAGELPKSMADSDGLPDDFSADDDARNDLIAQLTRQPVFLRDLFEKKIFLEYGLTRPSRNQHLARPALHRFTRWTAIIVLGGWSLGLLVATVELHRRNTGLVTALAQLRSDAQYRARAAQRGETIHPSWYRGRALALLAMNEQLRAQVRSSFFMPGSWHMFDDLNDRVIDRIEHEFGDIAVATLRRELLTRAGQLTGAEQDENTGEFIVGSDCKAPASFAALAEGPRRETLLVDNLPEFGALQRYVGSVEQLDQAVQALERLRGPGSGGEADLRLVVRYALGAELPADVGGSVRFFRQAAAEGGTALGITVAPLQDAVRCSFAKGTGRLDARLFAGNGLLVTEAALTRQLATASTASGDRPGFAKALTDYRGIVSAIKDQETLVASGNGGWMRQSSLDLGTAYERVLTRVGQIRLLGPEAAEQMRERASSSFQRFRSDFALAFGSAQPGIVWLDKDGRFALSPERIALRDAITALLAQPFVNAPADHDLPTIPPRALATWDLPRLDQALAVGDVRKRFTGDGLAAFPANLRPGINAALDAQFARIVVSQTADALAVDSAGSDAGDAAVVAFTGARARLGKIQSLLSEMGATGQADALGALVSRDALERLRNLDDTLVKSELYAMSGRDFATWRGDKGPVLPAFGAPDAASLVAYLGQQFGRIEALGKQADVYLAALDPTSAATPLAQRWLTISRELERYRLKNPNSSLLMFEQFLVGPGTESDRANCAEKLAGKGPATRPGDFFSERYAQIYNSLFARCVELHFREQQEQWTRFSATFNVAMAGRHPFAAALNRDTPVADLGDVGQLLRSFDPVSKVFKEAKVDSTNARFQVPGQAARRFVDQFDRVSAFLAPLFPGNEEGATPGYDVAVEFRANQANESEGNQVIDWSFDVGSLGVRWRDAPKPVHWEFGMPVSITLRLAKDSPLIAATDPQQPAMTTDGQTVTYRFADAWALITLIQRQREAEPAMRPEGRSQLLRLEFPLRAAAVGDVGKVPRDGKARVYLRLMLSPAGKKTPVLWPGTFPTRAPEWALP